MTSVRLDVGKVGTTHVSFACQRCNQPLRLDHSFNNVEADRQIVEDLTATSVQVIPKDCEDTIDIIPAQTQDESSIPEKAIFKKVIPPARSVSDSGHDFTLLGESEQGNMENLSHRIKVTTHLFDIMSDQSDVDHPLCEECTDTLLDQLDQQLKITEDELKDYRDFLEKIEEAGDDIEEEDLDKELSQLKAEESSLMQQLESIEAEHLLVQEQLKKEKEDSKKLEEEEERYYKEYNEYKRQLVEYEESQRSIDNQLRYAQVQLEKLKKTNVFNATFHIWHSGHFGTINNFRLGRLPSVPVDWNEINAAWGQTVLLLNALANKMNLKFQRYRLVPYGNHSYVESLADKSKELPLYGSGGFKFFWDTKFDQAMVAFLDCLEQFKAEVEKGNTGFNLPYKIDKGKIEDTSTGTSYSIKIQFNSEEQWTKALKFMLTNLKWGLAWVSSQFANK